MSFKKNILSSSIAVAMIGSVVPAFAEDGAIEEVIVEGGIRASLLKSIDRKRNATGVVDAITAEDMGKFPDTNLAESLQRITGVSINRSNGEGSQITVRGMGPEFNLVTLNGRQMPTVDGRSFEFGNIATEAVSAVEVYKTTDASMPTGGIGATVNMETAKPLDNPGFSGALGAKAVMDTSNVNGNDVTPEVAGVFSNTFADDTIGVLVSASYQDRDNREQYAAVDNWMPKSTPADGWANNVTDNNMREDGVAWYPQNAGYNIADNSRQRQNSQLVLQFAPNDSMTTTLDYTNSKVDFEGERRGFGIWFGAGVADVATINENGTYTMVQEPGGDYATNLARGAYQNRNESLGLNIEWQASENLTLTFDAHDSSAITQGMGLGNDAYLIIGNTSGAGFDDPAANTADIRDKSATFDSSGIPIVDISFEDTNDILQAELQGSDMGSLFAGITDNYAENEMSQYQLHGVWDNAGDGALQSIGFGVAKTEQNFKSTSAYSGQLPAGWWGYSAMFWDDGMFSQQSTDGLLDGFKNGGSFPVGYFMDASFDEVADGYENIVDTAAFWGDANCCYASSWPAELDGKLGAGSIDSDARVNEEVTSVYVQANFEDEFNGMPISTVAGLRYEESEVNSNGLETPVLDMAWVGGNEWSYITADEQSFSEGSGSTNEFLPSLSMSMDITDQLTSRFAYSRSLARPPIDSLRSTTDYPGNPKVGQRKVSVGNPQLKPYISDNIDLSLEYYYDEGSYVSVGYFKKIVDNFLVSTTTQETVGLRDAYLGERAETARAQLEEEGVDVRDPAVHGRINTNQETDFNAQILPNETDPLAIFDVTRDTNAETGNLHGWEIAAQHMFADTGWGVVANATIVNGDVNADRDIVDFQFALPGMSDSANLSVFYEKDQVSARVSYNWRDEYLNGFDQHSSPVFNEAYSQVDLSASYQVNDDLQLFVEGLNVTDQVQRAYVRYTEQLIRGSQYGPLYNLGARYTF
ncbi:MAG: TonB-dependent receptor [Cellvibrionales bacterium]|nr:TonB-dependent receptor [Cellvibrionales bacterium]